jgi:hypothetical protein
MPFKPRDSLLVRKLRGTDSHGERMPPARKPLTEEEIRTVEEWISQGAVGDRGAVPLDTLTMDVPGVTLSHRERTLNVACRSPIRASIRVRVFDEHDQVLATSEEWSVGPNEWMYWPGAGSGSEIKIPWSDGMENRTLRVELEMRFRKGSDPTGAVFGLGPSDMTGEVLGDMGAGKHPYDVIGAAPNPARVPPDLTTIFTYWLSRDSDVTVKIWQKADKAHQLVYQHAARDLRPGVNTYRWDFKGDNRRKVPDGNYVVRLQCLPRHDDASQRRDIVMLYKVSR